MSDNLSKGERTSQAILAAAYSLFLEQGFHATSMRQIARRSGLALGGIYNHFESKEQIFEIVLLEKHPYHQVLQILRDAPGDSLEEFIRNAARTISTEMGRRPDILKLAFIELNEFKARHVPILARTIFPEFYPLLQRFQKQSHELRDLPQPILLVSFLGTIVAYLMVMNFGAPAGVFQPAGDELDHFIDIFLHGVLNPNQQQPAIHGNTPEI